MKNEVAKVKHNPPVKLSEARLLNPPVDPCEAVRNSLQIALFSVIGETDIEAIAGGLVKRAKEGDMKATKVLLDLINQKTARQTPPPSTEKTVLVSSPGLDRLRKLVALSMVVNGGLLLAAVQAETGLDLEEAEELLNHPWFIYADLEYRLSPAGRAAVG